MDVKNSSCVKKLGAGLLVASLATATPALRGQSYQFSGGFPQGSLSGPSQLLPPGVTYNSNFTGSFNLNLTDIIMGISGDYQLPDSSLTVDFVSGAYSTQITYSGLTLDTVTGADGTTSLEIEAANSTSSFSIGHGGSATLDGSLGSIVAFLDAPWNPVTDSSIANLTIINPISGFPPAEASGNLGSLSATQTPEPSTGMLMLLGGLAIPVLMLRKASFFGTHD